MSSSRHSAVAVLAAIAGVLVYAAPAMAEQKLVTIDVPSHYVDATKVKLSGAGHPKKLQANVLLPDGYDGKKRFPVLYLLHGASGRWDSWAARDGGDIRSTAKGLGAIVVMPEGGDQGFYSDWWNKSAGGTDQRWESYFREELIPLVERRFRILPERRWHAIGGLSMGGYGTMYLATQMPGYFADAIPMSGLVSIQRALTPIGIQLVASADYNAIYGPVGGFYAAGHNPEVLAANLEQTRVDVYVGDGAAAPGVPQGGLLSGPAEIELHFGNDEMVGALRRAGVSTTYKVSAGTHDWPYWRANLRAAIKRGIFGETRDDRTHWSQTTVSSQGEAWGLGFRFATAPTGLVTIDRRGRRLLVKGGASAITVDDGRGCTVGGALPLDVTLPAAPCRGLRVRVSPGRVRVGKRTLLKLRVIDAKTKRGVVGARVRIGSRSVVTGTAGRAKLRLRPKHSGRLRVAAAKAGWRGAATRLRIRR